MVVWGGQGGGEGGCVWKEWNRNRGALVEFCENGNKKNYIEENTTGNNINLTPKFENKIGLFQIINLKKRFKIGLDS